MDGGQVTGVLIVATICATIVILRVMRYKFRHRDTAESPDVGVMQEINRGLQRMEDRIEALETLLFDQKQSKSKSESEYE
jgi:phage shock protein B